MNDIAKEDENAHFLTVLDEEESIRLVYIQTREMQSNFRHGPQLTIMDTTHSANVRKLHINTLMVLDREKNGRVARHTLMRQETTEYYMLSE